MHPLTFFPFSTQSQTDESLPGSRFLFSSSLLSSHAIFHASLLDSDSLQDVLVLYCGSQKELRESLMDLNQADEHLAVCGGTPTVLRQFERVHFKTLRSMKHFNFFLDGCRLSSTLTDAADALSLPSWPRRLIVYNLSNYLQDPQATIGTLTSLYASLLSFQAHIAAHSTEPELLVVDTRIHNLSLPTHAKPSQPGAASDLVSAWSASFQYFDWLGSVARDTDEEEEDTHMEHSLTWTPSHAQLPKMYTFQPTSRPSQDLPGLYSQATLHAWRQ